MNLFFDFLFDWVWFFVLSIASSAERKTNVIRSGADWIKCDHLLLPYLIDCFNAKLSQCSSFGSNNVDYDDSEVSFTLYVCVCVHLSSYVTDYVYMWKAVFDLNGQPTK